MKNVNSKLFALSNNRVENNVMEQIMGGASGYCTNTNLQGWDCTDKETGVYKDLKPSGEEFDNKPNS